MPMKDIYPYRTLARGPGSLALLAAIFALWLVLLLQLVPSGDFMKESFGKYLSYFSGTAAGPEPVKTEPAPVDSAKVDPANVEVALLAGGCFWGMEEILRQIPGVIDVEVGYTGGSTANPRYRDVRTGFTGHAESVRVVFDRSRLSYADLLEKWFFKMHDPTTKNRQGNDIGTQYRSAIFVATPEQREVALEVKERVDASGFWRKPIVTEIVDAGPFTLAEDEHQDYLQKYPGGYTCHFMRE
jgi:peptide methionine sulfoxide reductase msrA/msrB